MGATCSILLAAVFVGVSTAGLAAQDWIPANAHVRLRVKAPGVSAFAPDTHTVEMKGRAVAVDGGALLIARESPPDTASVPLAAIVRLEVQVRQSHAERGALVGGAVGATFGLVLGLAAANESGKIHCADYQGDLPCIEPLPIMPIMFGLLGALVGERLGRARWRRVPIPEIGAAHSFMGSGTAAFTLRVSF